jgi:polyisoprenoid-binding protein YceI
VPEVATGALTRDFNGVTVPAPGSFALDPSHTRVGFVARHMMVAKVRGSFPKVEGTLTVAENPLESQVDVTVQVGSVSTGDENRDAHLRSPDFFDVEKFPVMRFVSNIVEPAGPGRFRVQGDLTIRDVTRPVTLDVELEGVVVDPYGKQRVGFSATGEVDREEFGLTWNVAIEAGGVVVGKQVRIEIEAEAVRTD